MKDDIQIHGCFSFEPIFRNQPLSNHGIKQWILKWYLQRLSKLEFFYIGIYFLFCSPKSVREQLLFFSEGRSGFSWFWKITQQFSTGCQINLVLLWVLIGSLKVFSSPLIGRREYFGFGFYNTQSKSIQCLSILD